MSVGKTFSSTKDSGSTLIFRLKTKYFDLVPGVRCVLVTKGQRNNEIPFLRKGEKCTTEVVNTTIMNRTSEL